MVVVPGAWLVTVPDEETVATALLLEVQTTFLLVALLGITVATRVSVPLIESVVLLRLTPVTVTRVTVTAQLAALFWSADVTVIVAVPGSTPVTTPEADTVAMEALLLDQVTALLEAV
jgi:hypothetical protein